MKQQPEQKETSKQYMSIKEVCDYLGLSRSKFGREYKKFLPMVSLAF